MTGTIGLVQMMKICIILFDVNLSDEMSYILTMQIENGTSYHINASCVCLGVA